MFAIVYQSEVLNQQEPITIDCAILQQQFSNMKKIKILLSLALLSATLFFSTHKVNAQSAQELQVSPARHSLEVSPGETVALDFKFYNLGDKTLSGIIRSGDFVVTNNTGTPEILDSRSTGDQLLPRFSGAAWITLPFDRISIAPNDQAQVHVNIKVPSDARPGGRYVAVYFEPSTDKIDPNSSQEQAAAIISQRIAGLIYLRVKGPINEKAYVSRLFGPSFLEYGPINIETEILNRGDYHIRPRGSISLRNLFNATSDQKPIDEVNIFPDTSRSYKMSLGEKWMIGKYSINIAASYGDGGQIIQRSIDVWVFPWKIALAVFLGLIILFIVLRYIFRNFINKQNYLEEELKKEHEEVEKLRDELNDHK